MSDRALVCASASVRGCAIGILGVALALQFAARGWDQSLAFLVVGAGLAGGAMASGLAAFVADHARRAWLGMLGALSAAGVATLAICPDVHVALGAAFIGMLNGMGKDRSAQQVLETAILPATASHAERTLVIARYTMLQDISIALGFAACAVPQRVLDLQQAHPAALLGVAAALLAMSAILPVFMSAAVEVPRTRVAMRLSPKSRAVLWRLCGLFSLDALGGGFLTGALLSWFFLEQFHVSAALVAGLFFLARIANAFSHLGAAWLAARIGLVNTMVFTHIPSSLLLATVGFTGSLGVAAALFLVRESLVEMDVPTRQSYVMAVVRPEERTFVSAVTSLVRLIAWALSASISGVVIAHFGLAAPLLVAATLKITYDILLYWSFRHLKPPEEEASVARDPSSVIAES